MINLLHDVKCQEMLKKIIFRLRLKKYIILIGAIIMTIVCVYTFSEISIYNYRGFNFYHNLGLGWFGFILGYGLIALIWIIYIFIKYMFQLFESQKLYKDMVTTCDPLRTIYILDKLVQKKLLKEDNAFQAIMDTLKLLNHKDRMIYLLRKYPKAESKSISRINYEFDVLSDEEQELKYFDYYKKIKACFQNKKNNLKKKELLIKLQKAELSYDVKYYFYKKDYLKSIDVIGELGTVSPLYDVSSYFMKAKCYLGLEDYEKAQECLKYVMDYGNTTYYVQKAKDLMEQMS